MTRPDVAEHPKRLLVVTTPADLSLELLVGAAASLGMQAKVIFFGESAQDPARQRFDIVYVRDPFNTRNYDLYSIQQLLEMLARTQSDAYFVDHTKTWQDVLFEDKWLQYKRLGQFMPATEILAERTQFEPGRNIIKERLASRSRGLHFNLEDRMLDGNFIVQPLLHLEREYRVFVVRGQVLDVASLRSSKTPEQKLRTLKVVDIPADVRNFAERVSKELPEFDLLGLDIAELPDGQLVLIEANRSCQFKKFAELSGINPAAELLGAITGA